MKRVAELCILGIFGVATMHAAEPVAMKVTRKAIPFPLNQVRLLDGPFKHAMELDHRYLLSLDVDRLLYNFRTVAGLPAGNKPASGCEEPTCELRGHFVGHYLSACSLMYASTGDARLKQNVDRLVAALAECQRAIGNGYVSAFPEEFIDRVMSCKPVWAPWYTLHKIYAGLLDAYMYCGNRQALEVARRAGDWVKTRADRLTDAQMERMLGNEHGGINDVLAELAAITGEPKYLTLAQRFNHHAVLDPLSRREDKLTGLHANTQFPKILGAARQYELTGDQRLRTAATFFWDVVAKERSYVTGGNSQDEHFTPKGELSKHLSQTTTESCNTYNMRKITRRIFCWDPKPEYADYDERAMYNHILASQNPETGMMCYFIPLESGGSKTYNDPDHSFWCCTGTGIESHAKYGDSIYFHDGGKALYLNLFVASELDWSQQGVVIRQETRFPEEGKTRLVFACRRPVELEIKVRRPAWATAGIGISINGTQQSIDSKPSSYVPIHRTWATGDVLEVSLPMRLHIEPIEDNPNLVAILYGPLLLCGEVKAPDDVPVIRSEGEGFLAGIRPAPGVPLRFSGSPAVFRRVGQPGGEPMSLTAFYLKHQGPYVVYWEVCDEARWQDKLREHAAEMARESALQSRTVDLVRIGDTTSETAHKVRGEKGGMGMFSNRAYRAPSDGGWFSYEMKVLPEQPVLLACTYWGSDSGNRRFDVLIDGATIASPQLDHRHPTRFFEEMYPIPAKLTKGKDYVAVRIQSRRGNIAGGVFGLRVLRKD